MSTTRSDPAETKTRTGPVVTCGFEHTLSLPALLMWQHRCRTISVVDADSRAPWGDAVGRRTGHEVGVVTDLHVWAAHNHGVPLDTIRLVDLIRPPREGDR